MRLAVGANRSGIVYPQRWNGKRTRPTGAYPYGPTFDPTNGNTFETHLRRTTPVGVFPRGRTPEGIADLSGNVWEWTTTIWGENLQNPTFTYPYNATDGREDWDEGTARRVVRGGSWTQSERRAAPWSTS
ncbi:MAG: SUMF1/EgtB/PvdO family nonheme iron enzyme [Chloroflexi bacterium]|nr:SUMF1/EgtB/PvdO family nonheme iron enzyme [Chloroflexota bacterium]